MLTCIQICVLSHEVFCETNYFSKKFLLNSLLNPQTNTYLNTPDLHQNAARTRTNNGRFVGGTVSRSQDLGHRSPELRLKPFRTAGCSASSLVVPANAGDTPHT